MQLIAHAFGAAFAGVLVNLGGEDSVGAARLLLFASAAIALAGVVFVRRATRL